MKVDNSPNRTSTVTSSGANTAARSAKQAPQPSGSGAAQDNVQLSSMSTQIQALETSINEASGFDTAKVEALTQAIDEGNYTANAEVIADKLISTTRELLAQQKG